MSQQSDKTLYVVRRKSRAGMFSDRTRYRSPRGGWCERVSAANWFETPEAAAEVAKSTDEVVTLHTARQDERTA